MRQTYFLPLLTLISTNASARGYHHHTSYPDWFLFVFLVFITILSACSSYSGWRKRDYVHLGIALPICLALCWFLIACLSKINWSSVWDIVIAISILSLGWLILGASLQLMGLVLKTIMRIFFKN